MRSILLSITLVLFLTLVFAMQSSTQNNINPKLKVYCNAVEKEFNQIGNERKNTLNEVAVYINNSLKTNNKCQLMFICTHNSRRSQFGQVWAATAAKYYGIKNIHTFSGGIEVTACNYRTISALNRVGFDISKTTEGDNPKYEVKIDDTDSAVVLFSKLYGSDSNPKNKFAAIMVCGDADEKCPLVFGAEERFSLPYKDPKAFDDSDKEPVKYDERCQQIAREVLYIFSKIN
jgi:hypothetical protein